MKEIIKKKPLARDSIDVPFRVIFLLRYFKPFDHNFEIKDSTRETICRTLLYILLMIYNLQHVIFAIQSIGNMEHFITVMLVLISTINHLYKLYAFHVNRERIKVLLKLVDGPYFAAIRRPDEEILEYNTKVVAQLMKGVQASVCMCTALWVVAPFANRYTYGYAVIPAYFPFSTDSMKAFTAAILYKNIVIVWIGLGHVTLDCVIAAFYVQAHTQLSILRNLLARLTDFGDTEDANNVYIGLRDTNNVYSSVLEKRFIYCVEKYQKIIWFTREVESLFNNAQIVQLAMSIISLCVVMYRFVELASFSFDGLFLALYYFSFLVQLFVFCYCGTLIEYESNLVNNSVFTCDWITLSPGFRKRMIFAMLRWSRPLTISTANILPLSLNTFIGVLKLSYSLYTLLKETSR